MQERAVHDRPRDAHALAELHVFATQNPIEYEGTYPAARGAEGPLHAQDRDAARPSADDGSRWRRALLGATLPEARAQRRRGRRIPRRQIRRLRAALLAVEVRDEIQAYVVDVIRRSRAEDSVLVGAGPRAMQALLLASRASAALAGRDFVTPDDVKSMAGPVLEHRLILRPEYEIEGMTTAEVVQRLLQAVAVPR
jgi:MoxR-like ATPase